MVCKVCAKLLLGRHGNETLHFGIDALGQRDVDLSMPCGPELLESLMKLILDIFDIVGLGVVARYSFWLVEDGKAETFVLYLI
jgi:hypothetical protein